MGVSDDLDAPYRLEAILPIAYPNGGMTVKGLRRPHRMHLHAITSRLEVAKVR